MTATLPALQKKFLEARAAMTGAMVERDTEIDLLLIGLLAGEHVLFVGPPGCGKSHLLNAFLAWLRGSKLFSYLLTKFTTPEELFGPYSLKALKQDQFCRVVTGKLPEADFAYLDEFFKASPAIANTLLTIMNERTYDPGTGAQAVPLKLLLASSNEYPRDDEGLNAIFDRFLLRKKVGYIIGNAGKQKLLWGGNHLPQFGSSLSDKELAQAKAEVDALPWSDDATRTYDEIIRKLKAEGIQPSDRRLFKAKKIAQAAAWMAVSPEVEPDHLEALSHALWVDPETHPQKVLTVVCSVANPVIFEVNSMRLEVEQIIAEIDPKNSSKMAANLTNLKKLEEVNKKLRSMKKHPRVEEATAHVAKAIRDVKIALTDS